MPGEERYQCSKDSQWVGFVADLSMLQHQLRGTVEILDDCSFKVTRFDMLPGKDVYWWGAASNSLTDLLRGFPVSTKPLLGTFNSQTLVVRLASNVTWDDFKLLSVWSRTTASDYGHIALEIIEPPAPPPAQAPAPSFSPAPSSSPAPSPAPSPLAPASSPQPPEPLIPGPDTPSPGHALPSEPSYTPPPQAPPLPSPTPPPKPRARRGARQPTMFDNCMQLSHRYRVRWTLDEENGFVDVGLEAVVGSGPHYLGFGWADPDSVTKFMGFADVVIAGFDEVAKPFVEDYYITSYGECNLEKKVPEGVCPDRLLGGGNSSLDNVDLIYGHRVDGITFVRFRRPLVSPDKRFDHDIDAEDEMNVIWALGSLKPVPSPSSSSSSSSTSSPSVVGGVAGAAHSTPAHLFPSYHGVPQGSSFGVAVLTLSLAVDDCQSVLNPAVSTGGAGGGGAGGGGGGAGGDSGNADGNEDDDDDDEDGVGGVVGSGWGKVVVADRGTLITVTSGKSTHYPNPPSFTKSFYINGHEAPEIKVERGVPVQFSIQGGHDLPVYITSDPVGGRFNSSEIIFAGGEEAHGVPADPYTLLWKPTSSTPDLVYYQCYSEPKMGWRIHVVDGGLSDMYNHSFQLADGLVTMFWTLTAASISVAVRGEHPSGYIAIAFGSGMVNSWAYVGWVEGGEGRVASYWIDSKDARGVHAAREALDITKCMQVDGVLTFEFSRPLKPPDSDCDDKCSVIDPSEPLKVIWAYGPSWTSGHLSYMNMHTVWSTTVTILDLETGEGTVEHLQPVFVVHGFMMTMAWAVLMPFGVLAARYLKHNDWLSIHQYTQYSALALMLLGLLFAVGELGGIDLSSNHAKIGMATFALGCFQPINAFFRPPKPSPGERPQMKRVIWQWVHILSGRGSLLVGGAALVTGIIELGETGGDDYTVDNFLWAMLGWFAIIAAFVWFVERTRRQDHATPQELANMIRHDWNGSSSASSDMHVTQLDSEDSEDDTRTLIPSTVRSSSSSSSSSSTPAHTFSSSQPNSSQNVNGWPGSSASPARGNPSNSPARLGPTAASPARLGPTAASPARLDPTAASPARMANSASPAHGLPVIREGREAWVGGQGNRRGGSAEDHDGEIEMGTIKG
ncbi:hypothetical protein CLOP_g4793 [Closterium sp. NIES-67]|nr:hypothetical protein CLOP_g4793 [Closterium sp. NIES-67]